MRQFIGVNAEDATDLWKIKIYALNFSHEIYQQISCLIMEIIILWNYMQVFVSPLFFRKFFEYPLFEGKSYGMSSMEIL